MTAPSAETIECTCAKQVNNWLRQHDAALVTKTKGHVSIVVAPLSGESADLPVVEASYCPFCGKKYLSDSARRRPGESLRPLTKERLRELLEYYPKTGLFFWRKNRGGGARIGSRAGRERSDGYVIIRIEQKYFVAHRLAFLWMTGSIPQMVDHKNGVPSDNRWTNLRSATPRQNTANRRINSNSKTGLKGVQRLPRGGFRAVITLSTGRRKVIGHFATPDAAHAAYREAAVRVFGEFARFE